MQDMTVGNPLKLIIFFSIPIMLASIFQQFYILSDLYLLGHYIGIHALAVAGSVTPVFIMAMLSVTGFTNGLCVITAQRYGAKDIKNVRKSFAIGLFLSFIFAVITICFLIINMHSVLKLMNIPKDIYDDSFKFMTIMTYALFATIFYNYLSGILRALGDSKTPLYFLIFSAIFNIIINTTFIIYFHFDVTGVAIGTTIAQATSVILSTIYILKKFPILKIQKKDWNFSKPFVWEHIKIGIPMGMQFTVIGLGIIIVQSVCNTFGSETIAAFSAATRIEQLTTMPLFALGVGVTTYTAQNFGARLIRRIRQGVLQAFILSMFISIIMAIIAYKWGANIASLFLNNPKPEILKQAVQYNQTTTLFYFALASIFIFRQALQGLGHAILPLISGIIELTMRWGITVFLATTIGYTGLCFATPIAWCGGALCVVIGYLIIIKKYKTPLFGNMEETIKSTKLK